MASVAEVAYVDIFQDADLKSYVLNKVMIHINKEGVNQLTVGKQRLGLTEDAAIVNLCYLYG